MAREKGMGCLQREKSGRWTMRVCIHGKRYSRSTRTKDRDQAERFLQRFLAPLGLGERRLPLADVWLEYVKSPNRNELSKATLEAKRIVWMHFAKWMEKNYLPVSALGEVTREMIAEYLACLRADLCGSTYNGRVCVLREIFRTLADKAGLEDDPWEGVRLRPDDSHSRRELTMDELRRLLEAAKKIGLGRRSRSTEEGPVLPMICEMYEQSRCKVSDELAKIFKAANIAMSVKIEGRKHKTPEATFHSLRHTFVSFAANAGIPLHFVQSIVGHESTAMTRHYYHEDMAGLRRAVAAIPAFGVGTGGKLECRVGVGERSSPLASHATVASLPLCEATCAREVASTTVKSVAERLKELEELKAAKAITGREYKATRARILAEL